MKDCNAYRSLLQTKIKRSGKIELLSWQKLSEHDGTKLKLKLVLIVLHFYIVFWTPNKFFYSLLV